MDRLRLLALLKKLETIDHDVPIPTWASLLLQSNRRAYASRGLASPVHFRDYDHRLQVYAERCRLGFEIFHPSDTH